MSQLLRGYISTKKVEHILKAQIKQNLSAKDINTTTKQGNKELKFLVNKVATHAFETKEQVETTGDKLGSYLSELFQQKNKQNLDASLIRQVCTRKDLWSLLGLSVDTNDSDDSFPPQKVSVSNPETVLDVRGYDTTASVNETEVNMAREADDNSADDLPHNEQVAEAETNNDLDELDNQPL